MIDDESSRLAAVLALQTHDRTPEPAFDDIVLLAQRLCQSTGAVAGIVAPDRQWCLASAGDCVGRETPINRSICVHALAGDDIFEIGDLSLDDRTGDNPLVLEAPHLRFYAGAILRARDGQALGTLCVVDRLPRPEGLTPDQREALRALARQTVRVLDLRRTAMASPPVGDAAERRAVEARRSGLVRLGDALRDTVTTSGVVACAAAILGETLGCSRAGYAMVDVAAGLLSVERDWTAPRVGSVAGDHLNVRYERTIERLGAGQPVVIGDTRAEAWLEDDARTYSAISTRALVAMPLRHRGGLVGVMFVHAAAPRDWSPGEVEFVGVVADRTHSAISRVMAEDHQRSLNDEMSRRLKNTLAMVQAIAAQTLRDAADRIVLRSFEERIVALGNAQDVLLRENWAGASARALVDGVLRQQGCEGRVRVSGPDLRFGPTATLSVALLIHELATNAVRYGALSNGAGTVDIAWDLDVVGPMSTIAMIWTERGGPPPNRPKRHGFGARVIAKGIAGTGVADVEYSGQGLVARFRAPMSAVTEA